MKYSFHSRTNCHGVTIQVQGEQGGVSPLRAYSSARRDQQTMIQKGASAGKGLVSDSLTLRDLSMRQAQRYWIPILQIKDTQIEPKKLILIQAAIYNEHDVLKIL